MTTAPDNSTSPQLPSPSTRKPSAWDALQSFDLRDNLKKRFARVPCQRKALLFGIVGGSAIGVLRMITTRRGRSSANWGVYSFALLSSVSFYNCSKKHEAELEQIQTVIEKLNQLKLKDGKPDLSYEASPLNALTPEEEWKQREAKEGTESGATNPQKTTDTQTFSTPAPVTSRWWRFW
ncbi:hypothetical protein CROQUDRAFT_49922 [Cronartium quercuum f. sp. fusiforme G11]|uniref:Cytochrome c oxidase assembly protein COX20, mitochondrial n=1 Tax=Cronartium quercuum f. sp. fusiforme G11 TaxID=708437 RepID=A0A9P6NB41_9BASI|nr:hypothetical protein CROQUDRAFT_49922 [Cronartium quercuum f. sp. fusiforme G11]